MPKKVEKVAFLDPTTNEEVTSEHQELGLALKKASELFIKKAKGLAEKHGVHLDVVIKLALSQSKED